MTASGPGSGDGCAAGAGATPRSAVCSNVPGKRWHCSWWVAFAAVVLVGVGATLVRGWSRARPIPVPGVFRSGQLSADALGRFIRDNGIRTVVNLRGTGGGQGWHSAELQTCREHDVAHHTVKFLVDDWAPRRQIVRLLEIVNHGERPMVLHCRRGADRTGLGAAVSVLANGGTMAAAEGQLTLAGGHLCRRERCPQHRFLAAYRSSLERTGATTSGSIFETWVTEHYCPEPYDAALSTTSVVPDTLAAGESLALDFCVRNRGAEPWVLSSGATGVRLGMRVFGPFESFPEDLAGLCTDRSNAATDVARSGIEDSLIGPNETRQLSVSFRAPTRPGLYLLQADMVREHEHWFCEMGWPGLFWEVQVTGDA